YASCAAKDATSNGIFLAHDASVPAPFRAGTLFERTRRRPTLPGGLPPSTIGAGGLNCRVRHGNRCDPAAMVAGNLSVPQRGRDKSIASTNVFQTVCDQALGRLVPVG